MDSDDSEDNYEDKILNDFKLSPPKKKEKSNSIDNKILTKNQKKKAKKK